MFVFFCLLKAYLSKQHVLGREGVELPPPQGLTQVTPFEALGFTATCCHVAMLPRHWGAQFQAMQVEGEPQYMAGVGTEVQAAPQVWMVWIVWIVGK